MFKRFLNWCGLEHSPSVYSQFGGKPNFKEMWTGVPKWKNKHECRTKI